MHIQVGAVQADLLGYGACVARQDYTIVEAFPKGGSSCWTAQVNAAGRAWMWPEAAPATTSTKV